MSSVVGLTAEDFHAWPAGFLIISPSMSSVVGLTAEDFHAWPAGFLIKNKIIQSLINNEPMLIELLNHCLDF